MLTTKQEINFVNIELIADSLIVVLEYKDEICRKAMKTVGDGPWNLLGELSLQRSAKSKTNNQFPSLPPRIIPKYSSPQSLRISMQDPRKKCESFLNYLFVRNAVRVFPVNSL